MRFMASGDLHLHNRKIQGRDRLPVMVQWLQDSFALCREYNVKDFFWAGDVIDSKHEIERETLLKLYDALDKSGLRVHWLRGNHETPRNLAPQDTLMRMFSKVCDVVVSPKMIPMEETLVVCLPWYPAPQFIELARRLTAKAKRYKRFKHRILITHVGLHEGKTSPSNIMLPQRVSITHLFPDQWDLILCGDYHNTQIIGGHTNAMYMGSPLPHTFGDWNHAGPWLVDGTGRHAPVDLQEKLPGFYPLFRSYRITGGSDQDIPNYDARNYNRIYCPGSIYSVVQEKYPTATVHSEDEDVPIDVSDSRLSSADVADPSKLIDRYCKQKGITDPAIPKLALGLLRSVR